MRFVNWRNNDDQVNYPEGEKTAVFAANEKVELDWSIDPKEYEEVGASQPLPALIKNGDRYEVDWVVPPLPNLDGLATISSAGASVLKLTLAGVVIGSFNNPSSLTRLNGFRKTRVSYSREDLNTLDTAPWDDNQARQDYGDEETIYDQI